MTPECGRELERDPSCPWELLNREPFPSFCGGLSASPGALLSWYASLGLDLHWLFHQSVSHVVPTGKELYHSHPPVLELGPLIILLPDASNEPNPRGT